MAVVVSSDSGELVLLSQRSAGKPRLQYHFDTRLSESYCVLDQFRAQKASSDQIQSRRRAQLRTGRGVERHLARGDLNPPPSSHPSSLCFPTTFPPLAMVHTCRWGFISTGGIVEKMIKVSPPSAVELNAERWS